MGDVGGRQEGGERGWVWFTWLNYISELLADSKQKEFLPGLFAFFLWYSERPCASFHVPGIFPDWFHASFKEMHRIFHLECLKGQPVISLPEGLEGYYVF